MAGQTRIRAGCALNILQSARRNGDESNDAVWTENSNDLKTLSFVRAGKAVGAPFVGAVASCFALSEILRLLHGGTLHQVIDLDLRAPEHRTLVRHPFDWSRFNPGFFEINSGAASAAAPSRFVDNSAALVRP